MLIEINYQSVDPIYLQIIREIKRLIKENELKPGSPLPPIRKLASQLDISVNTIARAYQELDREGYIESGGRKGTFVKRGLKSSGENKKGFKEVILDLIKSGQKRSEIEEQFRSSISEIFD